MKFTKILDFIKINNYTEFNIVKGFCESISNKGGLFKMKKMKKMLALTLAFVLAVTILPMVGNVEARAEEEGFYIWYRDGNTGGAWEKLGTPAVDGISNPLRLGNNGSNLGGRGYNLSDWGISSLTVTSHGYTREHTGQLLRLGSGSSVSDYNITFNAPCDGTVEILYRPGKSGANPEGLEVNNVQVGDLVNRQEGQNDFSYLKNNELWTYTMQVTSGESYLIDSYGGNTAIAQINFFPSVKTESIVSTIGAAYREEGGSYGNGVRFGSELDKTSADYSNIQESGTLIAIQEVVGQDTELTMNTNKCKAVTRTTVFSEDNSKLQYTVVVINIPEEKKDSVLVARPYVKMNDGTVVYGTQISGSWNSIQAAVTGTVE